MSKTIPIRIEPGTGKIRGMCTHATFIWPHHGPQGRVDNPVEGTVFITRARGGER